MYTEERTREVSNELLGGNNDQQRNSPSSSTRLMGSQMLRDGLASAAGGGWWSSSPAKPRANPFRSGQLTEVNCLRVNKLNAYTNKITVKVRNHGKGTRQDRTRPRQCMNGTDKHYLGPCPRAISSQPKSDSHK